MNNNKLSAVGCMIFCGSSTIGAMNAGYEIDQVLEISDDIVNQNAYHFVKNYPNIPVTLPSKWENPEYLAELKTKNLDLLYANCPCSSLSSINRNASVDGKNNIHFYRVFDAISAIEPKTFIIENAPTLIKLGYPIIQDLTHQLGDKYRFTILRDEAGNHNVPMKRMRTMLVGWRRDEFEKTPLLHADKQPMYTIKDCVGDLYTKELDESFNHVCLEGREWAQYEHLSHLVKEGETSLRAYLRNWETIKEEFNEKDVKYIERIIATLKIKPGIWDKTPIKARENGRCPSMTSLTKIIHPTLPRQFTLREYMRVMGFPDTFKLYEGGQTPLIQCLAQGVPANFITWVTTEIKEALSGNREMVDESEDKIVNFQHHIKMKYESFTQDQIDEMTALEVSKSALKLED